MKAWNEKVAEETQKQVERLNSLGWYHSIRLPGGAVIEGLQSLQQLEMRLKQFPIPEDLRGRRVLDIGAWDGWFSFEMERRGATVVAVDLVPSQRFLEARSLLGSKVEYHVSDVYDLDPKILGTFDIVLFFGVLYHLKHPLLGLERVCRMSTGEVFIESFVSGVSSEPTDRPIMEFYETTELCGQFDNWVGPNVACLMSMCRAAGFASVAFESVIDSRAHVSCSRMWPPLDTPAIDQPGPHIVCVENAETRNFELSAKKDHYVSIWFRYPHVVLDPTNVFPIIGGFGVRPVLVRSTGADGWQAVVMLPPGIESGWRDITIRVLSTQNSNTVNVGLDISLAERLGRATATIMAEGPRIHIVADGKNWKRNTVFVHSEACISIWIETPFADLTLHDAAIRFDGFDLPSVFVAPRDENGLVQVNALLPSGLNAGTVRVNANVRGIISEPADVEILLQPRQP